MRVIRLRSHHVDRIIHSPDLFDETIDIPAVRAYLRDPSNIFLLAIEDGIGVGFLRGTSLRQLHTRQRQMFLYEIEVLVRYRQRGIARALIERLERDCRRSDHDEMFVFTSPNNRPAVRLYRSTGGVTETAADRMFVYRLAPKRRGKPRTPA